MSAAFPFWRTVGQAFALVATNFQVFAICLLPAGIVSSLSCWVAEHVVIGGTDDLKLVFYIIAAVILPGAIWLCAELKWLRFILLSEQPGWLSMVPWRPYWQYFKVYLLISAAFFALGLIIIISSLFVLGDGPDVSVEPSDYLLGVSAWLAVVLVFYRIAMALPAAAVGHRRALVTGYQLGTGVSWRMLGSCALFLALPVAFAMAPWEAMPFGVYMVLSMAICAIALIFAGFLALVYQQLTNSSPSPSPQPSSEAT